MKNIIKELAALKEELRAIDEEFKTLPPGYLAKRGKFYYHGGIAKEIGITKNPTLIQELCRKKIIIRRKKEIDNYITSSIHSIKNLNTVTEPALSSFQKLIESLPLSYQGFPISYFFHPSIKEWLSKPVTKNTYFPENLKYTTTNGITVRSKSELLIANLLEAHGIPYLYDSAFWIGSKQIYPDFIIKNPFTGKLIIWEHFGALNQPEYAEKMIRKMTLYQKYGYLPFENFIYTFESDIEIPHRLQGLIESIILKS